MDVIPVNFGLKYRPPKLGVQYYLRDQPTTHFVHEISLSQVNKSSNIDAVVREIIENNKFYLNPKVVSQSQVRRLVERMVRTLNMQTAKEDKENSQLENNSYRASQAQQILKGSSNVISQQNSQQNTVKQQSRKQNEYSPSASEQSLDISQQHNNVDNNGMPGGEVDLLISDIQQNQSTLMRNNDQDGTDLEQLLKTGAFTKEMMMGSTMRDLGNTIKEVNANIPDSQNQSQIEHNDEEDQYEDDFNQSQQQNQQYQDDQHQISQQMMMSGFGDDMDADGTSQQQIIMDDEQDHELQQQQQEGADDGEEEDVIDIDNPDELAKKGLKRIQIEGEEEEFLMDMQGNIYDLAGNFIGTTDGDGGIGEADGQEEQQQFDSQIMDDGMGMMGMDDGGDMEQYVDGDEY